MVAFPPAVSNKTKDHNRCCCEIENASIKCFCRFFAQLLSSFCTNGTLSFYFRYGSKEEDKKNQDRAALFHGAKVRKDPRIYVVRTFISDKPA